MKNWIRAAINNSPAMNTLMLAVLFVGLGSLAVMRRESFPQFELDIILISVPYPGASPEEVEEGICQKIEEAVRTIDGIKKVTSVAQEGAGSVILELDADVRDPQRVVNDVRSEVDRIPSFPELAEDPEVAQIVRRESVVRLAVTAQQSLAEVDVLEMRALAEKVRDELLLLGSVSQVEFIEAPEYQIDIEVDESTLRKFGLSLSHVASIVRRENLEVPGGTIKGQGQEILLRGENKRLVGQLIAELPLVTAPGGAVLTIGDVGNVKDQFVDKSWLSEVNGRAALVLDVRRTDREDVLKIAAQVRDYARNRKLPGNYELIVWGDLSVDVQDRLDMLIHNGILGLILVFIVLALFLELRLAFWVAMGIPVALLGAGGLLLLADQSLNMISMFAFLMALGIVVDDAIVVGENIYAHRQLGKSTVQAALDGTLEVMPSVTASVATTVVAFCPMFFVSGTMGKFIAVMPVAVIAMLLISLAESLLILPCHLAHPDSLVFRLARFFFYPLCFVVDLFQRLNTFTDRALQAFIMRIYSPALRFCLRHRWTVTAAAISLLLCAMGLVRSGITPFVVMPKLDSNQLQVSVTFPDGTPLAVTDAATRRIVDGLHEVDRQLMGDRGSLIRTVYRRVGSSAGRSMSDQRTGGHIGVVDVELVEAEKRDVTSQLIAMRWREAVGEIAGTDALSFASRSFGPAGMPIEFKLLASAQDMAQLEAAVERCKVKLATYPAVFDIDDDSRPGKWEYRVRVKSDAQTLGVTTADVADTLRSSYYGAEVMRLQRGRHEVKLMVRYPEEDRRSLADFQNIWVRTTDGSERPLTEVAEVDVVRGYSEINRVNQKRSITVLADLDEQRGNAAKIVADLQAHFMPELLAEFDGVQVRWEGQQEQAQEAVVSLIVASLVALLVMFVLLTLEFKAYAQPLLIMAIIPFGLIGAIFGHALMELPITLISFYGLVALTGVVVNDSIVLIDFINQRVDRELPLDDALVDAAQRRFRPVLLTSATTIAGLLPILLERSFQAQILIPMATSICFGLSLTTFLVLLLVPALYRIYRDLTGQSSCVIHPELQVATPTAFLNSNPALIDGD